MNINNASSNGKTKLMQTVEAMAHKAGAEPQDGTPRRPHWHPASTAMSSDTVDSSTLNTPYYGYMLPPNPKPGTAVADYMVATGKNHAWSVSVMKDDSTEPDGIYLFDSIDIDDTDDEELKWAAKSCKQFFAESGIEIEKIRGNRVRSSGGIGMCSSEREHSTSTMFTVKYTFIVTPK